MGRKILIADEDANLRALLSDALRDEAETLLMAVDGKQAIELAKTERPDLILADVVMPEVDGYEVCRIIHQQPGLENVPIILLTASDHTEATTRSFEAGAQDFVAKPFAVPNLRARVRTWLMRASHPSTNGQSKADHL
ncbi:MAG: response regulator [Chloroflexi bacterium]|nr:response regulator [Chloroflexota bacterium]